MNNTGTLIKFGKLEHIQKLQNEGILYLNNLPYFWKVEDEVLRGDPFDGIDEIARGPEVKLCLPDDNCVSLTGKWEMSIFPHEYDKTNIYCMYALRPLISFPVDEKNFMFGEYALLLINGNEFLRRIESSMISQKIKGKANLVEYVDNEYAGKLGYFKKRRKFAYQSEWRLVCFNGPGREIEIRIGSIQDISTIMPSDKVNTELRVVYESDNGESQSSR